jgi:hypothetical protein
MCQSCAEGGRRCRDRRRLQQLTTADLAPEQTEQLPEVDWAGNAAEDGAEAVWRDYAPAIATETIAVLAETRAAEQHTTADVVDAIPAGARPHGLEFRMKSPASLARKIRSRATTTAAAQNAGGLQGVSDKLTDLLRYTAVTPRHDDLPGTATTTIAALRARGYTVVSAEHSYVAGNAYKGIHVLVQHGDERPVEIQFHSELSQAVKDQNHVDYEIERDRKTPYSERKAAHERMTARSNEIPAPAGLGDLSSIGGRPLTEKTYPNPYSVAHNETEETNR